ncbi:PilN domain-containing protein [Croceivirga radicis]|uniref:PilN domain-containing protein n=1 Tax=Croceivirga radicis TaxID=1929488 RepID=UPI000255B3DF|nr:PilN domain-containing protein [Croceivirga radicis]
MLRSNLFNKKIQALEVFENQQNKFYALTTLRKIKGEVEIEFESVYNSIAGLIPYLSFDIPLLLVVNTTKVLTKESHNVSGLNEHQCIESAFPNLDVHKFHYEIVQIKDVKYVCIIQKSSLDKLLSLLQEHNIVPTQISLGISGLPSVIGLFKNNVYGSNFIIENIETEPNYLHKTVNAKTNNECDYFTIKNTSILGLATTISFINKRKNPNSLKELNKHINSKFFNRKFSKFLIIYGLVFFVSLLLLNYLIFSNYYSLNQQLSLENSTKINQLQLLEQLKADVMKQQKQLQILKQTRNSASTKFVDDIGNSLPASITLTKLIFNPIIGTIKDDSKITFSKDHIQVSGTTRNKSDLTDWVNQLASMNRFNDVQVTNLKETNRGLNNFTISIHVNEIR